MQRLLQRCHMCGLNYPSCTQQFNATRLVR
jgi:hypothetical protein